MHFEHGWPAKQVSAARTSSHSPVSRLHINVVSDDSVLWSCRGWRHVTRSILPMSHETACECHPVSHVDDVVVIVELSDLDGRATTGRTVTGTRRRPLPQSHQTTPLLPRKISTLEHTARSAKCQFSEVGERGGRKVVTVTKCMQDF